MTGTGIPEADADADAGRRHHSQDAPTGHQSRRAGAALGCVLLMMSTAGCGVRVNDDVRPLHEPSPLPTAPPPVRISGTMTGPAASAPASPSCAPTELALTRLAPPASPSWSPSGSPRPC